MTAVTNKLKKESQFCFQFGLWNFSMYQRDVTCEILSNLFHKSKSFLSLAYGLNELEIPSVCIEPVSDPCVFNT